MGGNVKIGFSVHLPLQTFHLSLRLVCISPAALRSLSFGLGTPEITFLCSKGGGWRREEVEDDWFLAPLATALHYTLLYSIPPPRPPPPCSLFITARPALSQSHWPRGPKHTIGSQEAQSDGKTVGLKNLWDEHVTEFDITCACKAAYTKRRACGAIVACCHWCAH